MVDGQRLGAVIGVVVPVLLTKSRLLEASSARRGGAVGSTLRG